MSDCSSGGGTCTTDDGLNKDGDAKPSEETHAMTREESLEGDTNRSRDVTDSASIFSLAQQRPKKRKIFPRKNSSSCLFDDDLLHNQPPVPPPLPNHTVADTSDPNGDANESYQDFFIRNGLGDSSSSSMAAAFRPLSQRSSAVPSLSSNPSSQSRISSNDATSSSLLAPASQFGIAETQYPRQFESPSKTPKMSGSSSLFGAVMKNVSQQHQQQHPSTPARQPSFPLGSPGGFQLMDFVNSVTSPFAAKKCATTSGRMAPQTPRHQIEWHSTTVAKKNNCMRLIDWTLQSNLQIQCEPSLPVDDNSVPPHILAQVLQHLSFSGPAFDQPNRLSSATIQWHQGLLYWQHPSSTVANQIQKASSTVAFPSRHSFPELKEAVSKTGTTINDYKKKDCAKAVSLSAANSCWQQAFQSLVATWIQKIGLLKEKTPSAQEVADTYFYALGNGHTILFRIGVQEDKDDDYQKTPVRLVPEIVVSSSSLALRQQLRDMGATWFLLSPLEDEEDPLQLDGRLEFHEDMLPTTVAATKQKTTVAATTTTATMSSLSEPRKTNHSPTKADLLALRRAQAFGQTAGADVSFSMRTRNTELPMSKHRVPPLYLLGMDDCLAFCEVYLNALGQISTGQPNCWRASKLSTKGLPLLLCRKLGPFLHSTLGQAAVRRQAQPVGDIVDVSGILLPCAIRSLVGAVIQLLTDNEPSREDGIGDAPTHAVFSTTLHNSGNAVVVGAGAIGDASSKFLNSSTRTWNHLVQEEDNELYHHCLHGERVQTVVWDLNRPSDLAYKLDYVSSFLMS